MSTGERTRPRLLPASHRQWPRAGRPEAPPRTKQQCLSTPARPASSASDCRPAPYLRKRLRLSDSLQLETCALLLRLCIHSTVTIKVKERASRRIDIELAPRCCCDSICPYT